MKTEFEVKFLNVDHDHLRSVLTELGARLEVPMRLMQRVTIDTPEMKKKDAFVRIRDQGDKVTVTYKQFDALSVDGAKEIEVEVDEFWAAVDLLAAAGLPYRSFQESKRETWRLGDVEIVMDIWPWLNPYIEIEGLSESAVRKVAQQLGFSWKDAVFGDVMAAYRAQYPHLALNDTVGNLSEVKFGALLPDLLRNRK